MPSPPSPAIVPNRQEESVIGVNQFMVLPLAFLSSTLLPVARPGVNQHVAWNPVNWAVEVGRQSIVAMPDWAASAAPARPGRHRAATRDGRPGRRSYQRSV
jgi:ABC-2 type transport system permease protein